MSTNKNLVSAKRIKNDEFAGLNSSIESPAFRPYCVNTDNRYINNINISII